METSPSSLSNFNKCEYVVFSGGAIRGIALCSAFRNLCDLYKTETGIDFISQLKGTGGTSIGACLALAIACGMDLFLLEKMTKDPFLWNNDRLYHSMNPIMFYKQRGFATHSILYEKIDFLFSLLCLPLDITFEKLYKITGRTFMCNASCCTDNTSLFMSHTTTPYMRVRDALCMSMCIPCIFAPFIYNGKDYVDGGYFKNYIIDQFPTNTVIGFLVYDSPHQETVTNSQEQNGIMWIGSLLHTLSGHINTIHYGSLDQKYRDATIHIYTPEFGKLLLSATQKEIDDLWEYGKCSLLWHFYGDRVVEIMLQKYMAKFLKHAKAGMMEKSGDEKAVPTTIVFQP